MSIKLLSNRRKRPQAWTLVDLLVGLAIFSISSLSLAAIFLYSVRSYAAMTNYAALDIYNRRALDTITFELRQSQSILNYVTNSTSSTLTFLNGDGLTVNYIFDSSNQEVRRTASDGTVQVLLTNCSLLNFGLYMRPPTNGTFDVYPVQTGTNWQATVKVVQLTWKTGMTIAPTTIRNSEDIQTARIVIRKQQDS